MSNRPPVAEHDANRILAREHFGYVVGDVRKSFTVVNPTGRKEISRHGRAVNIHLKNAERAHVKGCARHPVFNGEFASEIG